MGALLAELRELQLADELTTADAARAWAKTRLG
jgi:phosphoribosylaminoimidazole-succinocarboxamide synthase